MRILVKIGGAQLEEAGPRHVLCKALARARAEGHELIVVHGGGNQIRQLSRALQLPEQYHDGLRVTDARTAEVVLMVLGGLVNRTLVASLQRCSVPAVGLCGADGGLFSAQKLERPGVDLGFVGTVDQVRPQLVRTLLASGHVPVIATVAPGRSADEGAPFFNLNADHAAGPLCRAFGCDALLFLTDVPAVLDADKQRLPLLTPAACARLIAAGTATGGMLPKLDAALLALRDNPRALVKIAPGGSADAVLQALRETTGTTFTPDSDIPSSETAETHHG
ncbi:MAG: acetylglutamate kinase [Planctomycetes bacterium]|jgi:acetylglutamate kinase|nr:acetylglutamate kinase [Planctomycetota bacterium]